jgi:hypothetical protein
MSLYAAFIAAMIVFEALASPFRVGTVRNRYFPTSQFIGVLLLVPIFGRVFGWW